MADTKISNLTADTSPTTDDLIVTVNDPAGTPANKKVTVADLLAAMDNARGDWLLSPAAAIDINSTAYVTLATKTLPTAIAAGSAFRFEIGFNILNNSGGTKTYTVDLDVNGFLIEVLDGGTVGANATNKAPFVFTGFAYVVSTSSAFGSGELRRGDPTAAGTPSSNTNANLRKVWNSSGSDLTGSSKVIRVQIKSSAVAGTAQTADVLWAHLRKIG